MEKIYFIDVPVTGTVELEVTHEQYLKFNQEGSIDNINLSDATVINLKAPNNQELNLQGLIGINGFCII